MGGKNYTRSFSDLNPCISTNIRGIFKNKCSSTHKSTQKGKVMLKSLHRLKGVFQELIKIVCGNDMLNQERERIPQKSKIESSSC